MNMPFNTQSMPVVQYLVNGLNLKHFLTGRAYTGSFFMRLNVLDELQPGG